MKKLFITSFLTLVLTTLIGVHFSFTAPNSPILFLSPEFAQLVCEAWNQSELPQRLGAKEIGGNNWILTENKYTGEVRNKQVLVMSRRDSSLPKVQLTIENKDGKAICTYGGALTEVYEKAKMGFCSFNPTVV